MDHPNVEQAFAQALKHHQAGHLHDAERFYREILEREPRHSGAMHYLGVLAHQQARHVEAVDLIRKAIALTPDLPEAHNNLGLALRELGRVDEAIAYFRAALGIRPNYPETLRNLGLALQSSGRLDEAILSYRQALALRPTFAAACNDLGNALLEKGNADEAVVLLDRAIALQPDLASAYANLGIAYKRLGRLDQSIAAYETAIELNPNDAATLNNLGNALGDAGRVDEAIAAFRRAIALEPSFHKAHSNLVFMLNFHAGSDAAAIARELRLWNAQHAGPLRSCIQPHPNNRDPDRRLRVGYVSRDFLGVPVGRFLLPLLEHHDRRQIEVFAYAQVPVPDRMTAQLRAHTDVWRDVTGFTDARLADLIRQDAIDILVDLSLHAANNRLLVFARKPAPVQVTYLAYAGSSGLTTIDYRLSDPCLDPPLDPPGTEESIYSENTWRLPETYWCYQPVLDLTVQPPPAVNTGAVTFGCMNEFCKINEPMLRLWANLLAAVPPSRLLVSAPKGSHRDRLLRILEANGVAPGRAGFVERAPLADYFALYHTIDIALDTVPYGGGTTTCDSLWMGVPVVSLKGQRAVGRGGYSILSNIGLPELVASTPDDYVQIAAQLAGDLPRLADLRLTLRQRMQRSPLMDAPRFARNIEAAYRRMWQDWCKGHAT
jgi:predicted O-linked N-acetylglucosamine transferase (SPINDLY family)